MLKLRDKLRKHGYNVWMDVDKMGEYLNRVYNAGNLKQNITLDTKYL